MDIETDEPQFATVKEGFIGRHLTFVPLGGLQVGPNNLQVPVTNDRRLRMPRDADARGVIRRRLIRTVMMKPPAGQARRSSLRSPARLHRRYTVKTFAGLDVNTVDLR